MVFQNYALYPHLTVYENIAFPLRLNKNSVPQGRDRSPGPAGRRHVGPERASAAQAGQPVRWAAPAGRDGGAGDRARCRRFLFDEPLSNLDAKLRGQMRTQIAQLQRKLGTTSIYVTHDQTEAMTLGGTGSRC